MSLGLDAREWDGRNHYTLDVKFHIPSVVDSIHR